MGARPLAVMVAVLGLVLSGCAPASLPVPASTGAPETAVSSQAAGAATMAPTTTPTNTAVPSPAVPPPAPTREEPTQAPPPSPPAAGPTDTPPPTPAPGPGAGVAFWAWGTGPDGRFYLLQSSGTVRRHSPDMAAVIDESGPLFAGQDPGRAYMAIGDDFLVLSSETLTRTLVLERESFAPVWQLDKAGPVALDGSRRLFVLSEDAVWAYDLANAAALPAPVTEWPVDTFTPRPRNLAVDSGGKQLLVTLHDASASPPHQQEWFAAYDLDTLQPLRTYPGQSGELTRPSVGRETFVAGLSALSGFLGSKVAVFDREGREARAAQPLDGKPVVDPAGEWIYVLRERGIWVLRAGDLGLVAVAPSQAVMPVDLLLSPDGATLYTVGEGEIGVLDTARLREAGIAPLPGPLLPAWFDPARLDLERARFFPAPGSAGTAFVEVGGYGETWRSRDLGRTWELLPGLVHPDFHYATHLSISPDFTADQTLVAVTFSPLAYIRSTDGGDTWAPWAPPVAFVSDRDGNREIYTADRGEPRGGPAQNLVRRTNDPAVEENPAWSPGWTRIAFQSNRGGNWDIYTIRADCDPAAADAATRCDLRRVTDDPGYDMLPAWSPDGRWIAFVSTRDGSAEIYLAPADGGPATRLTTSGTGAWRPAWLPDSRRLLYTATTAGGSNDIVLGTIAEGFDGKVSMSEGQMPVAGSPADERDPAVAREYFVYLSNESGVPRAYRRYSYDMETGFPTTAGMEPEGHPAVLDDGEATILVTLVRDGQTGIYRANSSGYEPYVTGTSYNGQPAAGPVPWQPAADWSEQAIRAWQTQK